MTVGERRDDLEGPSASGEGVPAGEQQCALELLLKCSAVTSSCSSDACLGAGLEGGQWLEREPGCNRAEGCLAGGEQAEETAEWVFVHTWGLGLFLFTEASGPGMLLAPHLLLDALLAAVAKIVLSPSVSAQSALPRASFCKRIVPPSLLSLLPLDYCRVRCRTWTHPLGQGGLCLGNVWDGGSAGGPGCHLLSE